MAAAIDLPRFNCSVLRQERAGARKTVRVIGIISRSRKPVCGSSHSDVNAGPIYRAKQFEDLDA